MEHEDRGPEVELLDWHLERLEDEDRSRVEQELQGDAELRAISDRLGRILQPLDHWQVAPAPSHLADKVLAHIERSTQPCAVSDPASRGLQPARSSVQPETTGSFRRAPLLRLRDVIAAAACILLLVGVFVPGIRDRSRRAICENNLGSVFKGTSVYQQTFAGSLPFAGHIPGASWLPGSGQGRPYASNSRHLYKLVKLNCGPEPKDFICPGDAKARPMSVDNLDAYDDFACARNISYDTLNLSGRRPNLRPAIPLAYLSDHNPLFVGGRFNESVNPGTNSPVHRGRGQTVLALDGSVEFKRTPFHGSLQDNLWLIGNLRRYTGTESPTRDDDVQLVPGYPVTDPAVLQTMPR